MLLILVLSSLVLALHRDLNQQNAQVTDINKGLNMGDTNAFKDVGIYGINAATKLMAFYLYTRDNQFGTDEFKMNVSLIKKSHFSSSRNTYFLIHG